MATKGIIQSLVYPGEYYVKANLGVWVRCPSLEVAMDVKAKVSLGYPIEEVADVTDIDEECPKITSIYQAKEEGE